MARALKGQSPAQNKAAHLSVMKQKNFAWNVWVLAIVQTTACIVPDHQYVWTAYAHLNPTTAKGIPPFVMRQTEDV